MAKLKVLFFAANPQTTPSLRLDEEARAIRERVRASTMGTQIQFETRWATRPDDLIQELNEYQPHVVHCSGHGGSAGLAFQDATGDAALVSGSALAHLFSALKDNI